MCVQLSWPHPALLSTRPCGPLPLLQTVVEPGARAAYLWVVGEYGAQIQDAPYVLESLSEGFSDEATEVKLVSCEL